MSIVQFPMLKLSIKLNNVAFSIFNVEIYWYAILIVTAMFLGVVYFQKRDGMYNIKFADVVDLLLVLIPISIISARLYYVIFDIEHFIKSPGQILNFRTGGLAIYGGIIGGFITCIIFCKKRKIQILDLLDFIVPALLLGQAIGRWGNFINVEAYGTETKLPWRMGIYEFGIYKEVHPTFLYESIATFTLFIILAKIAPKRKFTGQITYLYLICYGLIRMLIEWLRTDSLMLGPIRISQLVSAICLGLGIILYKKSNRPK